MELIQLNKLFSVHSGNSFDLNMLEVCDENDVAKVNYVSRTRENNGISAFVKLKDNTKPFEEGLITVAGSGNSVLESFIQLSPFYTGYHVFLLKPLNPMSDFEKLFYCYCIRQNQFKYSFGRQANKTLKDILLPKKIPKDFLSIKLEELNTLNEKSILNESLEISPIKWVTFNLMDLFKISASRDGLVNEYQVGKSVPYISSTEHKNGIIQFVNEEGTNKAGTITANRGGSVGYFFFQPIDYIATPVDVRILTPKFAINIYIGFFLTTILRQEKYRFNYSRKMGTDRLGKIKIKLPANKQGKPDFEYMEKYIKSLPYSASI